MIGTLDSSQSEVIQVWLFFIAKTKLEWLTDVELPAISKVEMLEYLYCTGLEPVTGNPLTNPS